MENLSRVGGVILCFLGMMYLASWLNEMKKKWTGKVVLDVEKNDKKALQAHKEYVKQGSSRNVSLPSSTQAWIGTYEERGDIGHTCYTIEMFKSEDDYDSCGSFEGFGEDCDGTFWIRNAVYGKKTGKLAWGEHSVNSNLVATCEAECVDEACIEMEGFYRASSGVVGTLKLKRKVAPPTLALDTVEKVLELENDGNVRASKARYVEQEQRPEYQKPWYEVLSKENEELMKEESHEWIQLPEMKETAAVAREKLESKEREEMERKEKEREVMRLNEEKNAWYSFSSLPAEENENEWVSEIDQESGKTYYWNRKTRQTTWYKPAGFTDSNNLPEGVTSLK